jgi:hypothetical protein
MKKGAHYGSILCWRIRKTTISLGKSSLFWVLLAVLDAYATELAAKIVPDQAVPKVDLLIVDSEANHSFFDPAPRVSCSYHYGSFIKIRRNYLALDLFAPIYQRNQKLFLFNCSAFRFSNENWAFSGGVGLRGCAKSKTAGIHIFYDALQASCKTFFQRLGLSLEWLDDRFDLRANGYFSAFPSSGRCGRCVFDQIGGGYHAEKKVYIAAYPGFDVEVGKEWLDGAVWSLYSAAGSYFFGKKCLDHFWGVAARIEGMCFRALYVSGRLSYDNQNFIQIQGSAGIRIPLDFSFKKIARSCAYLLGKSVERNGIIMTDRFCDWSWNW